MVASRAESSAPGIDAELGDEHPDDREQRTAGPVAGAAADEDGVPAAERFAGEREHEARLADAGLSAHGDGAHRGRVGPTACRGIPGLAHRGELLRASDQGGERPSRGLDPIGRLGRTHDAEDLDSRGDALHLRVAEGLELEVAAHDLGGGVADRDLAARCRGLDARGQIRREPDDHVVRGRVG